MATKNWVIDPTHSEIQFKIKHLMITNVTGSFKTFEGSAQSEGDDFVNAKFSFSADIDSISTDNGQRDGHLKAADFFDAAAYPTLNFVTTQFTKIGDDGAYQLQGDLTMKNVTKNIQLNVDFGGIAKDGYGNLKAGFSLNGKINRKDFGLSWSALTEGGGLMLGEDVKILGEIQLVQQA